MNDELVEALKKAQATTFSLYLKAHNFHWNVEGPDFAQYHDFLGDFYAEVFGAVDTIAELIRTLQAYAPGSLTRFKELSTIEDELSVPKGLVMMARLNGDNQRLLVVLNEAYRIAESQSKFGISNAIQDRITAHEKHGWMLRSFTKE
jgi:starvation-inducible DNA-binding protein